MSILIVDDDPDIRKLLALRLRSEGYDVIRATSAESAFEQLGLCKCAGSEPGRPQAGPQEGPKGGGEHPEKIQAVDLVMMDILLPDLSGIEACRRIKESQITRDIPVIMITASSDLKHLEEAFEVGAMDYLAKPFKKVELLARIRSALRLKAEIDQRKKHELELMETARRLQAANVQLEKLSFVDSLTELYNRRYFDEALQKEFNRAMRSGCPLSLVMIDIDAFKPYNDVLGHQAGDECLKAIAREFKKVINRSHDLVARYGGEEFAAILPDTSAKGAFSLAESLRHHVMALSIAHPTGQVLDIVTISLGVACMIPPRHSTPAELVAAADKALYRSKSCGRNRATLAA